MIKCPVCGNFVEERMFLVGMGKCQDCVVLVKTLRNVHHKKVTCLGIIFGNLDGWRLWESVRWW